MSPDVLLDQEFGLVADLIHGYAQERPQHPALIHESRVLTYGELDSLVDRVAASLQRDGIRSGEVISICAASCVESTSCRPIDGVEQRAASGRT